MTHWFTAQPGAIFSPFLKTFIVLFFVLLAIYAVIKFLHHMQKTFSRFKKQKTSLTLKESLAIDAQRKLILIEWENSEYLIYAGLKNEFLLEKKEKPISEQSEEIIKAE